MDIKTSEIGQQPKPEPDTAQLMLAVPRVVYEALAAVAHDEGHTVEEQALRAIQEMLTKRKRRPLVD